MVDSFSGKEDMVIAYVSFKNEADAIRNRGGCIWYVSRPNVGPADKAGRGSVGKIAINVKISNLETINELTQNIRSIMKNNME